MNCVESPPPVGSKRPREIAAKLVVDVNSFVTTHVLASDTRITFALNNSIGMMILTLHPILCVAYCYDFILLLSEFGNEEILVLLAFT